MNKNFLLLFQGQFVSQIGNQVYALSMLLWLKNVTGKATVIGLLMALSSLPAVLLGVLGGTIADRYPRRNLLVATDLLSGLAVLAVGALLWFAPAATQLGVAGFCVAALVTGALTSVFNPAVMAVLPDIVPAERVAGANSLFQGSIQIANLAAQALAGIFFRLLGAPLLVLLNGLSYLFAAICETFIRLPPARPVAPAPHPGAPAPGASFRRQLVEGLAYVVHRRGMRVLVVGGTALRFFIVPFTVLVPFYVTDVLRVTGDWYGYLVAAFGAGLMIGYLLAGAWRISARTTGALLLGCMVAVALLLGALGQVRSPAQALAFVACAGVANGLLNVKLVTILQVTTPAAMRGRVFGLLTTVSDGLAPIAMLAAGVIADLSGRNISLIYEICGGMLVLISLALATSGELRAYLSEEAAGASEPQRLAAG